MKLRRIKQILACMVVTSMFVTQAGPILAAESTGEIVQFAEETGISFSSEYAEVGEPLSVNTEGMTGNLTYQWAVDGRVVGTGSSYTPTVEDLEKFINVKVSSDNGASESLQMFFSRLPVVYVNTEGGQNITSKEDYINADLKIQGNDEYNLENTTLYNGVTEIKGRGNSTWGLPKKPYKLKLDKSTNLLGFGKSKHWVLLANYYDKTYMRNKLSYDLSGELGVPYMQSILTDVVLNGKYVGNYQLCEQIRATEDRVDVVDWEEVAEDAAEAIVEENGLTEDDQGDIEDMMAEDLQWASTGTITHNGVTYKVSDYVEVPDIDGGYIIEMDSQMDELSKFDSSVCNQPMMIKFPEYAYTNKDMMNYLEEYIASFERTVTSDTYTAEYQGKPIHYTDMFDMQSLTDNWIVQEIFFNEDFMKKSTYMYKRQGEKMKMGPIWDMDWSSGAEQSAAKPYDKWQTLYFSDQRQADQWYKELVQDPLYLRALQSRYWEIRDTYIQEMLDSIDVIADDIKESGNASLEAWGQGNNYEYEVQKLKDWMNNRMAFMDSKMSSYDTFESEFIKSQTELSVSYADGSALEKDTISRKEAAYDGMAESGEDIKVSMSTDKIADAKLYINGVLTDETDAKNNTVTFEIENIEKDSIVQVYAYGAQGNLLTTGSTAIKVKEKEVPPVVVTGIEITEPKKTEYIQGEELNLEGMTVTLVYSDGSKKEVTEGYGVTGYDQDKIGEQTIVVSYNEFKKEFKVTVKEKEVPPVVVTGIEITAPKKTEYTQGEDLNLEGLTVTLVYSDGSKKEVTEGYKVTGYDKDKIGEQTIVVSYNEFKKEFKVTVKEKEVPTVVVTGIEITAPKKTEYTSGEDLNLEGLTVTLIYSDGSKKEITEGYKVTGYDKEKVGEQNITVTYESYKETFKVTVKENHEVETPELPFTDVKKGDWYVEYIEDVYEQELMTGMKETYFGAAETLVRAQFAMILYRMAGEPKAPAYEEKFPDVPKEAWYTEAVMWAAEENIIRGYDNTKCFGANDPITREQMAALMFRYAEYQNQDTSEREELDKFPDADRIQDFAAEAVEWCVAEEIISGKGEGTKVLEPQGNTNRAECAAIISRYTQIMKD